MAKAKKETQKMLKVTLIKSPISELDKHKRTIEALGLKKIRSSVTLPDNDATKGMLFVVKHMVSVEEIVI